MEIYLLSVTVSAAYTVKILHFPRPQASLFFIGAGGMLESLFDKTLQTPNYDNCNIKQQIYKINALLMHITLNWWEGAQWGIEFFLFEVFLIIIWDEQNLFLEVHFHFITQRITSRSKVGKPGEGFLPR